MYICHAPPTHTLAGFTSTKVQILTPEAWCEWCAATHAADGRVSRHCQLHDAAQHLRCEFAPQV